MKRNAKAAGAMLASAVALAFLANPGYALAGTISNSAQGQVKCLGGNSCKGQSSCKTATSPGPGENSCKGQGLVFTRTAQECTAKGGHPASPKT